MQSRLLLSTLLLLPLCALWSQDEPRPGASFHLTLVDDEATGYATFQSHNQKVVAGAGGIFMTFIRTRNEKYTAQEWRLVRSTDGGESFRIVHESTNATNPPVIELDENGALYLIRPDFVDGNAYLYRFLAEDDYAKPRVSTIPRGAAGKYSMAYDRARKQLYYFAHNNTFHVVGLDGTVRRSVDLLRHGKNAVLQYPLLSLDPRGALHAAWTTQKHGVYLYWDIHHMVSPDGGVSWRTLSGKPLELPVTADDGGAATRITLDDEFESHTWLSSVLVKDGKAHFVYLAQTKPSREHYVRYDLKTGREDLRRSPDFKGRKIEVRGLSAYFATSVSRSDGPLYCIGPSSGRIACLRSDDNGTTWKDYAITTETFNPYSVGGARELMPDGSIIGSFTDQKCSTTDPTGRCRVYFFRIKPAGRASLRSSRR